MAGNYGQCDVADTSKYFYAASIVPECNIKSRLIYIMDMYFLQLWNHIIDKVMHFLPSDQSDVSHPTLYNRFDYGKCRPAGLN